MNYYGIAHVTLVFFTRTLSNSFEAFLFLALIYFVYLNVSSVLSIIINSSNDDNKSDTNIHRSTTIIIDHHLIFSSLSIGFICALGIFNRPTFPAFAIVPIMYWFTKIMPIIGHSSRFHLFLSRIISFIVGTFILTSILLILFDSYYYNNNGFTFLIDLKNRLVICPFNFIRYNIDSGNLDKHGLHPPWLHVIVNATMLFGPLHLGVILWSLSHISSIKRSVIDRIFKIFDRSVKTAGQSGMWCILQNERCLKLGESLQPSKL